MGTVRFADPHFKRDWIDEMLECMKSALESGWLTMGQNVQLVEEFFSHYLGRGHVIATNSCTAALHLALMLAGVSAESEVILPSETFVATANAVLFNQGTPVFAEIDPRTMNLDPADVEERITKRTACLVVVHMAGLPCNMSELTNIAKEHDLVLVEDCAHAHGALYDGKPCGAFGDFSCFSFYPTKVIGGAEGGLLLTPDEDTEFDARELVNQGRSGIGPKEITRIGYNYRMNELQACVLLPQLPSLDEIIQTRNHQATTYNELLSSIEGVELLEVPNNVRHSYYAYMVKVPADRRNGIAEFLNRAGIGTSVMYNPVHLQPAYRQLFGYSLGDYPVTEESCSRLISLPLHLGLTPDRIEFVCTQLENALSG